MLTIQEQLEEEAPVAFRENGCDYERDNNQEDWEERWVEKQMEKYAVSIAKFFIWVIGA